MSIRDRIEDAKILWEAGRLEGAIVQVLIAVAGTVRKRYPRPMSDCKAYTNFIRDEIAKITNGPTINVDFYYDGKHHVALEHIIYKFIRCGLVHNGCLPKTITMTQPVISDGKLFNLLDLSDVMGFPIGWIWNLIRVVAEAPENGNEFPNSTYPLPDGYSILAGFQLHYPDEHPERFPPNAPPRKDS